MNNWQIPKLSGSPDEIKTQLDGAKLPQNVRDFINAEIAQLAKVPATVTLMAYSGDFPSVHGSQRTIQIALSF